MRGLGSARMRCNIVQPSPFAVFRWRVPCSGDHTGVSVTPLGERVVCSATVVHLGSSLPEPNARGAADERREKERGRLVRLVGVAGHPKNEDPSGRTAIA